MQLYAFDVNKQLVFSFHAQKQRDYFCPECQGLLRLRGGFQRQKHFYHLETPRHCRQSGKSGRHLALQFYFLENLPAGECLLEHRFESIRRIADVVWLPKKIAFEIQCSPITAEEVAARNRDYASVGFQVVWILHDRRYNQRNMSAMELFLHGKPHYFTNFDERGQGRIYDQFSVVQGAQRLHKLAPLPIDPRVFSPFMADSPKLLSVGQGKTDKGVQLAIVNTRLGNWPGYFSGDLAALSLHGDDDKGKGYLLEALRLESQFAQRPLNTFRSAFKEGVKMWIIRPYILLFQLFLERCSK